MKNHKEKSVEIVSNNIHVRVMETPLSERYCKSGDIATLDARNKMIMCGGAWFHYDARWKIIPIIHV